jgi:SRSO17 transposase
VFAALSRGTSATLIDTRLYLPSGWVEDAKRCAAAGVPAAARQAKSKSQPALAMVHHNRRLGVRFSWVGMDGGYGEEPALLRVLADDGETFVADVHKDQVIYMDDPRPQVPPSPEGRGRKRTRRVAQTTPMRVNAWPQSQPDSAWQRLCLRDSSKGKLLVDVLHRPVWLWDGEEAQARCLRLLVRGKVTACMEIKYSLSNAAAATPVHRLAQMRGQRYWVERAFQDGKGQTNLDHDQARA